jgi:tetratricopeptide (TPR) repeat protein
MVEPPCPFAPLLAMLDAPPRVALRGPAPPGLARMPATAGSPADLLWLGEPAALREEDLGTRWIAWPRTAPLPPGLAPRLAGAGYALAPLGTALLARRLHAATPPAEDANALQARAAALPPAEALALLRLLAPSHPPARAALIERLLEMGEWAEALGLAHGDAAGQRAATGALAAFNQAIAAGDVARAESLAAALARFQPDNPAVLEAALACNRQLGQGARAARFAAALLALDPRHVGANLIRLEQAEATGDRAQELTARSGLALAPEGAIHPLRRLHEAHRAISLHLLRPLDEASRAALQALVAAARMVEPTALPEGEARHWARHYRHLSEAADTRLLGREAAPLPVAALHRAAGRPLGWAGLRRQARDAKVAFVVAADAAYLRLYGRAYLASILRNTDLPCVILVHVIGGARQLPALIRLMEMPDPRILYSADDFCPAAVTTQCHDSDGPRALPVAHFQCTRFAIARRVLEELELPVLVSDIDAVLQRGAGELLARFAGTDIVLNRNEASIAFGSHITANLLLAFPTAPARAFLAGLQGYLEAALAGPHVTRWIDQCGLQACWNASTARFGWFDTTADINNVMYPRWQPNPFLFLSLFHGFDMTSLPAAA